jgi:hypothetical protein
MENVACQHPRGPGTPFLPPPPRGGSERPSGPSDALRNERLWSACKNRASGRLWPPPRLCQQPRRVTSGRTRGTSRDASCPPFCHQERPKMTVVSRIASIFITSVPPVLGIVYPKGLVSGRSQACERWLRAPCRIPGPTHARRAKGGSRAAMPAPDV